jgi:hypothetical protein
LLQVAARKLRCERRQRAVEPVAMVRGVDGERAGFAVGARVSRVVGGGVRVGRGKVGRYNEFALLPKKVE